MHFLGILSQVLYRTHVSLYVNLEDLQKCKYFLQNWNEMQGACEMQWREVQCSVNGVVLGTFNIPSKRHQWSLMLQGGTAKTECPFFFVVGLMVPSPAVGASLLHLKYARHLQFTFHSF